MKRLLALALLLTGCAAEPSSRVQMVGGVGHVYVQGDHNGHPFQPDDSWGEDTATCGTKVEPCLTVKGALARVETLTDTTVIVHLGGWSDPSSIGGANDPWDGYATETRVYEAPVLPLRSSQATRNTLVWAGPRKMVAAGTQPTGYLGAVQLAPGRVKLRFTAPNADIGKSGLYLRFTEGAGRELFFPHVVSEATSDGLIVDSSYTAADWDWYAANMGGAFEVCEPGAHLVGSYDEPSSPVLVMGALPPAVGDTNDGVDINPLPALSRLVAYRPRIIWTGELMMDSMWLDVEGRLLGPGTLRQRGTTFCGGGTAIFSGVAGRVLAQDSGHDAGHERAGWARVPVVYGQAPDSTSDPYAQFGGPIDMTVSGGMLYVGGRGESQAATHLKIMHGVSVWLDGDSVPVDVAGPAAFLDVRDGASTFVGPSSASVWAKEGARVRLDLTRASIGTVRAGKTPAVTPSSGMMLTGDDGSVVWDRAWEPAGW